MTIVTFEEGDESPKVRYTDNGDGSYTPIIDLGAGLTVTGPVAVTISGVPSVTVAGVATVAGAVTTDVSAATNAFAITPNDGVDLTHSTRGIYVAGAGTLKATFTGSGTVTISGLSAGVIYPFALNRVFSAGTTASGLVGVY